MTEITSFLSADIRTATPLLLAALGIVFSERAGLVNISVEGMMLTGALMGVVGSHYSGSALVGTLWAMLGGVVMALVFGVFAIRMRANQIILGAALNIFATGFTITVNRLVFGVSTGVTVIQSFDPVAIPLLSSIPVVGEALFNQTLVGYLAFLLVPVTWFVLQRTNIGLKVRSVGENPKACVTVGLKVNRIRYGTLVFSGLMAGLAGAFVSMGQLSSFTDGVVAGRGYIAIAAVVFGNYTPVGVLGATLLFGASSALQYRLLATDSSVPYQFWTMLPYLITVAALCLYRRKSNQPAASGKAFIRE